MNAETHEHVEYPQDWSLSCCTVTSYLVSQNSSHAITYTFALVTLGKDMGLLMPPPAKEIIKLILFID